jgi:hypothetical protein
MSQESAIQRDSGKEFGVDINRGAEVILYPFMDYFKGFENVGAVRSTFGEKTEEVLKNLKVEFFPFGSDTWEFRMRMDICS